MEAIISAIWPYLVAATGALAIVWRVFLAGKQSGINQERVKHAASERENLEHIKRAADAKPVGGVQDDRNNRDNH